MLKFECKSCKKRTIERVHINVQSVPKRCIHKVNIPYYNVYTSFWDILYLFPIFAICYSRSNISLANVEVVYVCIDSLIQVHTKHSTEGRQSSTFQTRDWGCRTDHYADSCAGACDGNTYKISVSELSVVLILWSVCLQLSVKLIIHSQQNFENISSWSNVNVVQVTVP
jgi:hypothetical protein